MNKKKRKYADKLWPNLEPIPLTSGCRQNTFGLRVWFIGAIEITILSAFFSIYFFSLFSFSSKQHIPDLFLLNPFLLVFTFYKIRLCQFLFLWSISFLDWRYLVPDTHKHTRTHLYNSLAARQIKAILTSTLPIPSKTFMVRSQEVSKFLASLLKSHFKTN